MRSRSLFAAVAVLALTSVTAFAEPKDDLSAAVDKTAASGNYTWTTTSANAGGGGFGGGKTTGKTEKDGYTMVTLPGRNASTDVVMKGKKSVIKTDSGWQTPEEMTAAAPAAGGGGGGPGRFVAMQVQNFKTPLDQAKENLTKVTDIKVEPDGFSGTLPEEAAKSLMTFGRGRRGGAGGGAAGGAGGAGGAAPEVKNPKVAFHAWVKDGMITKFEQHITGSVSFNGNDMDIDRTMTTEITDVGTTKVEVPEEAKKKLEG